MKEQRRPASNPGSYAATWSASWAPGQYQSGGLKNVYSLNFDGTDDQLLIPYELSGTNFSISFWFKQSDTANGEYLWDSRNSESNAWVCWTTYQSGSNSHIVKAWCGSTLTGTTSIPVGEWAHVVVTKEGDAASLYVNGNLDHGTTTSAFSSITTSDIKVGSRYSGANYWAGNIDEMSVFTTALSATDVVDLYNAGTPNDVSTMSPSGWWRNGDATVPADDGTNGFIFDQADKTLGSELVTNGTFDTDLSGWTLNNATFSNQGAVVANGSIQQNGIFSGTGILKITWDQTINSGTRSRVRLRNEAGGADVGTFAYHTGSGSKSIILSTTDGLGLWLYAEASDNVTFDNISVKEVNGDTATINGPTIQADTP